MRAANQDVAGDPAEDAVRRQLQASAVFIDLSGESMAELRIESLEMSSHFLPRLLKADGSIGLGNLVVAIRPDQ